MIEVSIAALVLLNISQFFFWAYQVQKLVNKLMSRNFAEYNAVVKPPETVQRPLVETPEDREAEEALRELNALIPS